MAFDEVNQRGVSYGFGSKSMELQKCNVKENPFGVVGCNSANVELEKLDVCHFRQGDVESGNHFLRWFHDDDMQISDVQSELGRMYGKSAVRCDVVFAP